MTKTALTLTLVSLLAGCSDPTLASQAVTAPGSACDTTGTPVLQGAITLDVSVPVTMVSGTNAPVSATAIDNSGKRTDVTGEVTWSSSNLLAASPDKGTLYAIGTGSVTIRATLGDVTASADVSIVAITLESLALSADTETASMGALTAWHLTGHYNDGSTSDLTASASWTTSDSSIASVVEPGEIRAIGAGMTMVSAAFLGQQASMPFMVGAHTLIGLRIDGAPTMAADGMQQLTATGSYSDGSTDDLTTQVGWYTSDGSTAAVSLGLVQAISSGTVTISAATGDFLATIDLTLE